MEGSLLADRYRLTRPLGRGSTGSVWLARDEATGSDVALKILAPEVAARADLRARFLREARLASSLQSPHVVRVLDSGVGTDERPYLVMEYSPGITLRERLADEGVLSLEETAALVTDLCRGLAVAHAAGLVHRDLKPENVLLAARGEGEIATILDFGAAKASDVLVDHAVDPTRTGDLIGTPAYMSPEQAQGLREIDHRADLWAVGVIAFECATGMRPFRANVLGPLIREILAGPIPVPSRASPELSIPAAFDAWMRRALARSPGDRFASAADLASALAATSQATAAEDPIREGEAEVRAPWEAGDMAAAASTAIARLGPEILRYLAHVLGDAAAADDAFSSFCERLWRSLPRFTWRCSLRTWAYVIARRASIDVVRGEGRRRARQALLSASEIAEVAEQVRTSTLPMLRTEGRSALAQLRDGLPHDDKRLLILRIDRGLSWEDVARVFLDAEAPEEAELRRESARLRKRFQLVRTRLRERVQAAGIGEH